MIKKPSKKINRQKRHMRVRRKLSGTAQVPRLCIYRSLHHIYAQIIDDEHGVTLVAASTLDQDQKGLASKTNIEAARSIGSSIAKKALEKGISQVVFDRNGYQYHGCISSMAEAARESGLVF